MSASLRVSGTPAAACMEKFARRNDGQITTLEIMAITVGLFTFQKELEGRTVVVYPDNKGAEASVCRQLQFCKCILP